MKDGQRIPAGGQKELAEARRARLIAPATGSLLRDRNQTQLLSLIGHVGLKRIREKFCWHKTSMVSAPAMLGKQAEQKKQRVKEIYEYENCCDWWNGSYWFKGR
jgi:hypothetical protein